MNSKLFNFDESRGCWVSEDGKDIVWPAEQVPSPLDDVVMRNNFVKTYEPHPIYKSGDTITIDGQFERRTFWEWLTRKSRELRKYKVI